MGLPISFSFTPSKLQSAMACLHPSRRSYLLVTNFLFLSLLTSLPANTYSLSFDFPSFNESNPGVTLQGNASVSGSVIQLTSNQMDSSPMQSSGRALYPTAMQLWDASTKKLTDFSTSFNFSITQANSTFYGDGLAFLLIPENTALPAAAKGASLGMYTVNFKGNETSFADNKTIVAIEFDTFQNNPFDPTPSDHMGIDVNSVKSAALVSVPDGLKNKITRVFVSYDSTTKNLSIAVLSVDGGSVLCSVSYIIDLSIVLPQRVQVGFSAGTGDSVELHKILAWSFNSTLEDTIAPAPNSTTVAPTPTNSTPIQGVSHRRRSRRKGGLVAGIGVGMFLILIFGIAVVWFKVRKKSPREGTTESTQFDIDEDFDMEAGPKRFAYSELSQATNNFSIRGKLGEGGFGGVYKGVLTGPGSREIAVKRIKNGSNQGKKEYISEVKIISRLRHRNLVQLLGWCHDHGELLLVYEFMPNRSLDFHLFGRRLALLPWETRYRIALGLASALLYLHEEWEQSVVHRDIKSSNVMLDLNFNPKLGDFGLARLADHDVGLQTTAVAGTPGYMAPECLLTGKASKESDVYSFGIVALELVCGRKVIELKEEASKVKLVEWVWDLYGKGIVLEAVDNGLEGEFDEEQAKCLMVVGLWCSHPDVSYRPSIKQAIAALNNEIHLPSLPSQLPVPIYVSPGMDMSLYSSSYASFNMTEGNYSHTSSSSISRSTSSSLQSYPLLGTK